jgi:AcrR family transcriptional regulator
MIQVLNRHSAGSRPLRKRLREATRGAILEAAEDVYARRGIAGGTIEDVAERAGVSVGTVYNYFVDRRDLVTSIVETRRAELLDQVDSALARCPGSFESRLRAFLDAVLEHFARHRKFFAILAHGEPGRHRAGRAAAAAGPSATLRELTRRARSIVDLGQRLGRLRDEDPGFLAAALVGALHAVLLRSLSETGEPDLRRLRERLECMFLRGAGG